MMEPLTVAAVQMMKALAAVSLEVKKQQMMRVPSRMVQTMKVRGLAVRWMGQTLEVAAAPPTLIMQRAHLKRPHQ